MLYYTPVFMSNAQAMVNLDSLPSLITPLTIISAIQTDRDRRPQEFIRHVSSPGVAT